MCRSSHHVNTRTQHKRNIAHGDIGTAHITRVIATHNCIDESIVEDASYIPTGSERDPYNLKVGVQSQVTVIVV